MALPTTEAAKILGNSSPANTSQADLYTVPASTFTVAKLFICNYTGSAATFRVSVAPAGAADAAGQRLYYDYSLPANDTFTIEGLALAATDKVRITAGTSNALTFVLTGIEYS